MLMRNKPSFNAAPFKCQKNLSRVTQQDFCSLIVLFIHVGRAQSALLTSGTYRVRGIDRRWFLRWCDKLFGCTVTADCHETCSCKRTSSVLICACPSWRCIAIVLLLKSFIHLNLFASSIVFWVFMWTHGWSLITSWSVEALGAAELSMCVWSIQV